MNPLFSTIGVLYVDHYAVTTSDLTKTLRDYLSIPGSKLLRGPGENPAQGVYYAFVELNGMGTVEILAPLNSSSPIHHHIKQGSGAYHFCFTVDDLEYSITQAQNLDAKLVVEPRADGAFDGRKVAFLVHPRHGLFELLEAYPSEHNSDYTESSTPKSEQKVVIDKEMSKTKANKNDLMNDEVNRQALTIFNEIMASNYSKTDTISMADCEEWDSFKHLLLIMEIEKQFDIRIPAQQMAELNDFNKICRYLNNDKQQN